MRISVSGGGPSGLFFALIMKKARPDYDITVIEQNAADVTYGFGIGFMDWDFVEKTAPELHADLEAHRATFAAAETMMICHKGENVPVSGMPMLAIARIELLKLLQRHARQADVRLEFEKRVETLDDLPDADLYVVADGVNSVVRQQFADEFGTEIEPRPNMWAWYATRKLFPATSLIVVEHKDGIYIGHAHQYAADRSGFVVEALPETWRNAGFEDMSEEESRRYCTDVFKDYLDGEELISNRSLWFQVPMVTNKRWSHNNIVLIGDAMRTGHPTIGSGTRLAMFDSEHLRDALVEHRDDLPAALARYEETRKPSSDAMVRAAMLSTKWYETMADRVHLDPVSLAYSYLIRTGKIGHEKLREADPDLVAKYENLIGIPEDKATLAVIYHSGSGQTKRMADYVAKGAETVPGLTVQMIPVEEAEKRWTEINYADALVFGCPTYMGTVSARFKDFMEKSSMFWARQRWKGKLAAGFTTSSNPSGDKLNTLMQMSIFAAQHGMAWLPLDLLGGNATAKGGEENLNRLGAWMGVMGQARVGDDPETALHPSDLQTAEHMGKYVGEFARTFGRRKRPL